LDVFGKIKDVIPSSFSPMQYYMSHLITNCSEKLPKQSFWCSSEFNTNFSNDDELATIVQHNTHTI